MKHIEEYWKTLTSCSNELFDKGNLEGALSGYKEALYSAEVLNDRRSGCMEHNIPYMQMYVISCNNLSNVYTELKLFDDAERMLKRSVYYLLHLSKEANMPLEEIQLEIRRASIALLNFAKENTDPVLQKQFLASVTFKE